MPLRPVEPKRPWIKRKKRYTLRDKRNRYIDARYNTSKWQKYRKAYLLQNPFCYMCDDYTLATDVDHIVPVRLGGDFWNSANHQPLCKSCHYSKSSQESRVSKSRDLLLTNIKHQELKDIKRNIIFIVGNLASGKSTAVKLLAKQYKYNVYAIDDYRIKYNQGNTLAGEEHAKLKFQEDIFEGRDMIVEMSGASNLFSYIYNSFDRLFYTNKTLILIYCDEHECIRRHKERNNNVPFPYNISVENTVRHQAKKLRRLQPDKVVHTNDIKKIQQGRGICDL